MTALMKMIRRLERFSRPRQRFLFDHRLSNIIFGLLVIGGSLAAFFAPPFTGLDTLPSLGVVLLSLGVLLEDFIVVLALVVGAAGIVLTVVLGNAAINSLGKLFLGQPGCLPRPRGNQHRARRRFPTDWGEKRACRAPLASLPLRLRKAGGSCGSAEEAANRSRAQRLCANRRSLTMSAIGGSRPQYLLAPLTSRRSPVRAPATAQSPRARSRRGTS